MHCWPSICGVGSWASQGDRLQEEPSSALDVPQCSQRRVHGSAYGRLLYAAGPKATFEELEKKLRDKIKMKSQTHANCVGRGPGT